MEFSLKARFSIEYDTWKRQRKEMNERFKRTLTQRQTELHAKLEQESEGIRVGLQAAVVDEVLKTYP
jgi:hypothetical protein